MLTMSQMCPCLPLYGVFCRPSFFPTSVISWGDQLGMKRKLGPKKVAISIAKMTGRWYTYPSEKYDFVSWDDEIPNWMEK